MVRILSRLCRKGQFSHAAADARICGLHTLQVNVLQRQKERNIRMKLKRTMAMLMAGVMLIGLPVLSAVFGGFFFKYLPQYAAKLIMVFHVVCYGGFLLLAPQYPSGGTIHYLYAILVLWPVELLIMAFLNHRNKKAHPEMEAWEQEDVHAVDLTPWKYRKVCAVAIIICCIIVYAAFSPLGFGA